MSVMKSQEVENRPLASHPVLTDVYYKLQRATQSDATSLLFFQLNFR